MKKLTFRRALKTVNNFVVFFLTVGFAVSCCMLLFLHILADSMGLVFDAENIAVAAKVTFGNVLLLTVLFATADYIRRRITVDRPVRLITQAAQRIMQGDFSARVPPIRGAGAEGFDRIGKAINQMAVELSGTETLRTDFIANVSHEMKTPLAVMGNYAAMLQKPGLSPEEKEDYAARIQAASKKLAQLVTNILKLNKLENQQIFPQAEEFDLSDQLCRCLLEFEEAWEERQLQVQIPEGVRLRSDGELLSLVWSNLISNAVKFTSEGDTVSVTLEATQSHVCVTVRDTGCGMKPDTGKHIFEKFYQGDPSRATGGNGLGLALVKRVMDILGGEIAVESVYGRGSAFTVKLRR